VLQPGHNGLLVDFFSIDALAATIISVLADPMAVQPLCMQARRDIVDQFDLATRTLPRLVTLVSGLAARGQGNL
jgi:hypothetical protein